MTGRIILAEDGSSRHVGGRLEPKEHLMKLVPRLATHLKTEVQVVPELVDYTQEAFDAVSEVYLNDQIGDCVVAGACHLKGVFTGNARNGVPPFRATREQVIALYGAIGGYVDGKPETDQGCDELTALQYWQASGIPLGGDRIQGCLSVDGTNMQEVKAAIYLFEGLMFGARLPDAWVTVSGSSFRWDVGTPNPSNGHCFVGIGYNDEGLIVASWGMVGLLTWAALAANVANAAGGQIFAVLSQDLINRATQKSPLGLDWLALQTEFASLGVNG